MVSYQVQTSAYKHIINHSTCQRIRKISGLFQSSYSTVRIAARAATRKHAMVEHILRGEANMHLGKGAQDSC